MPAISFETLNKILPKEKQQSIIDSVFGPKMTPLQKAEQERNQSISDMFDAARQRTKQQRTDDVRMAKFNALGNALTTLVQPLGWAIGGKGTGVTGGVQPYDNRQYLDAFNRAVKASDDLRNISNMEDEYRYKIAEQNYQREVARAEEDRRQNQNLEYYQKKADIEERKQTNVANAKHENRLSEIELTNQYKKELENYRANRRISKGGLTVDDRMLLMEKKEYEQYKRFRMQQGLDYPTFDEYLAGEGYEVSATGTSKKPTSQNPAASKVPPSKQSKGSETVASAKVPPSKRNK